MSSPIVHRAAAIRNQSNERLYENLMNVYFAAQKTPGLETI